MKHLLVFVFATCAFAHSIHKIKPDIKIVGGIEAAKGQFPYQISLRYSSRHTCGGSIASNYLIVTAAHCVDGRTAADLDVVAGSNQLNQNGLWHTVADVAMHEQWNPTTVANDVAILTLSYPIVFTVLTQPIPLEKNSVSGGTPCVLSGWGLTSYPGIGPPNDLQYFEGSVVELDECIAALSENLEFPIIESNICAFAKEGVGACQGDSGGPLVANGKQIGIVSWGVVCAKGFPDVYTKISHYATWFKEKRVQL